MDEPLYTRTTIDRLVEGVVWKGLSSSRGNYYEVDGAWAELRAHVEHSGDLDSEAFLEVMDLENAIASLKGNHAPAAAVVTLRLMGFSDEDVRKAGIRNPSRLATKAKAWLSAYLSGEDPEEAYRRTHRERAIA